MSSKIKWVWIDCFSTFPLDKKGYNLLKKHNLKLCFVSPDLQGQHDKIEIYKDFIKRNNFQLDAICVKIHNIKRWES